MALPPLASVTDLATWLGQTIAADDARAVAVLAAASAEVRDAAGLEWVTDDEPPALDSVPQIAITITLTAAKREWLNPTGASRQVSGPYQAELPTTGVFLTPEERARCVALNTSNRFGGIAVLCTTRGDLETASVLDCDDGGLSGLTEADNPYSLWP